MDSWCVDCHKSLGFCFNYGDVMSRNTWFCYSLKIWRYIDPILGQGTRDFRVGWTSGGLRSWLTLFPSLFACCQPDLVRAKMLCAGISDHMEPGITEISFTQMLDLCESIFLLLVGISDLSAGLCKWILTMQWLRSWNAGNLCGFSSALWTAQLFPVSERYQHTMHWKTVQCYPMAKRRWSLSWMTDWLSPAAF